MIFNTVNLKIIAVVVYLLLSVAHASLIDYDIVYVRYPIVDSSKKTNQKYVSIPQGERPYDIAPGADLVLLKPDGSEQILVDCNICSVMDPYISYDAKWVYYSLIEKPQKKSASAIYKIDLSQKDSKPIRLTYDDGFDSHLYAGNQEKKYNLESYRAVRDMAPVPLADGRILFTSNRSALVAFNPGTDALVSGSIQQLYVMDDHDGSKNTDKLANLKRLEAGTLHMAQHPIQLVDGRILFSSWQDAGNKFLYAMTNLMVVNPDGTNLMQFTEPHDHHKMVEHFITQLSDEKIVSAIYYPSFDYGFGILMRYPLNPDGPDFLRGSIEQISNISPQLNFRSYREFDRKGGNNITPHTAPFDRPAPNLSGKYSMPSATKEGGLLVAYSKGSVNYFGARCKKVNQCEPLRSGIYLIPDATSNLVNDPQQLIEVKDDPNFNEIWPRAVLPYQITHGQSKPDDKKIHSTEYPEDGRLLRGEAAALIGTSSMYNREVLDGGDIFQSKSSQREKHDGNWTIQGAEAGVFSNSDIYGVRIISTPAIPYTLPLSKYNPENKQRWKNIVSYLDDKRLIRVVARYASFHGERWEVMGEFPLTNKNIKDEQGNPDSSWLAKIPAESPFLIQAIDKNGMTLNSELTWRALKPGEKRADCGGCHAHSIEPLDFNSTAAGKGYAIPKVKNVDPDDPRIKDGIWDLTQNSIPLLTEEGGVEFVKGTAFGVEFNRDILPLINRECSNCHNEKGSGNILNLSSDNGNDPYLNLTRGRNEKGKVYKMPQLSKYIRSPQARQSLLIWTIFSKRLDGRTNESRDDDIDLPKTHPEFKLTTQEKRLFARWIDLGGAYNFLPTDGFGYTDDYQLPTINLLQPTLDTNGELNVVAGFNDIGTGIDWQTLTVSIEEINSDLSSQQQKPIISLMSELFALLINQPEQYVNNLGLFNFTVALPFKSPSTEYLITIRVNDKVGNNNIATQIFTLNRINKPH